MISLLKCYLVSFFCQPESNTVIYQRLECRIVCSWTTVQNLKGTSPVISIAFCLLLSANTPPPPPPDTLTHAHNIVTHTILIYLSPWILVSQKDTCT